jgi:hypothetical protein
MASRFVQGRGFVHDNKPAHFAYYFSSWAWPKEVPAIMLVLWLHSDSLAKRPLFFLSCASWHFRFAVNEQFLSNFWKMSCPRAHSSFPPVLLPAPKLKQRTHNTGSEWLKRNKFSEIFTNLSIEALTCASVRFVSCLLTKSATCIFCTQPWGKHVVDCRF